ncbi:MAG: VanW family protein [Mycobacteriales bacterium]
MEQLTSAPQSADYPRTSRVPQSGKRRTWRSLRPSWPLVATAVVVVVAIVATGVVVLTAGEVPRGTRVLGVDIGGRSKVAAVAALRAGIRGKESQAVKLRFGGKEFSVTASDIGMRLDLDATIKKATHRSANPFSGLLSTSDVDPVIVIDQQKLRAGTQAEIVDESTDMVRPTIVFDGTTPKPQYGTPGEGLRLDTATAALRKGWLRAGTIKLLKEKIYPKTDHAGLDELMRALAQPAVSGPVKVQTEQSAFDIKPDQIAASLKFDSDAEGAVEPKVDPGKLAAALDEQLHKIGSPAREATIKVVNGKLQTTPSKAGVGVDIDKLAVELLPVLRSSAAGESAWSRVVKAGMGPQQPKLSTEQLGKLGVTEQISSFTTNFSGGEERNKNILLVADKVDNAMVMPGETFALNKFTGERGPAQGYVLAPVILNGKLKNEYGGGISQFATTLYNAIFFSGLKDIFHQPHSYYISRYPAGREATVYYPSLDVIFKNDSTYGVLIDTSYTSNSVTVSFWSTKRYDIGSVSGSPTNPRPVQTQYLDEEGCIPTKGAPGFDITVERAFKQNGREIKRESSFTSYKAEPNFICGKAPQQNSSPSSSPSEPSDGPDMKKESSLLPGRRR